MSKKLLLIISFILTLVLAFSFVCFAEPEDEVTEAQTDVVTEAPTQAPETNPVTEAPTQAPAPAPAPAPATTAPRNLSNDNSLAELTVVGKTEEGESVEVSLDPAFSPSVRTYNLSVPFEVVRLEISAKAGHSAARISIPSGYLKLDLGQNRSFVYVTAENGSRRTYQINTTRNEEEETTETTTEETTETTTEATTAETTTEAITEVVAPVENTSRFNKYTKLGIVFACAGVILFIISVAMLRRKKADNQEEDL